MSQEGTPRADEVPDAEAQGGSDTADTAMNATLAYASQDYRTRLRALPGKPAAARTTLPPKTANPDPLVQLAQWRDGDILQYLEACGDDRMQLHEFASTLYGVFYDNKAAVAGFEPGKPSILRFSEADYRRWCTMVVQKLLEAGVQTPWEEFIQVVVKERDSDAQGAQQNKTQVQMATTGDELNMPVSQMPAVRRTSGVTPMPSQLGEFYRRTWNLSNNSLNAERLGNNDEVRQACRGAAGIDLAGRQYGTDTTNWEADDILRVLDSFDGDRDRCYDYANALYTIMYQNRTKTGAYEPGKPSRSWQANQYRQWCTKVVKKLLECGVNGQRENFLMQQMDSGDPGDDSMDSPTNTGIGAQPLTGGQQQQGMLHHQGTHRFPTVHGIDFAQSRAHMRLGAQHGFPTNTGRLATPPLGIAAEVGGQAPAQPCTLRTPANTRRHTVTMQTPANSTVIQGRPQLLFQPPVVVHQQRGEGDEVRELRQELSRIQATLNNITMTRAPDANHQALQMAYSCSMLGKGEMLFDGSEPDNFEMWAETIREHIDLAGFSDAQALNLMKRSLRGDARDMIKEWPPSRGFESAMENLYRVYATEGKKIKKKEKFWNSKFNPKKYTAAQYLALLINICPEPLDTRFARTTLIQKLKLELPPGKLRKIVLRASSRDDDIEWVEREFAKYDLDNELEENLEEELASMGTGRGTNKTTKHKSTKPDKIEIWCSYCQEDTDHNRSKCDDYKRSLELERQDKKSRDREMQSMIIAAVEGAIDAKDAKRKAEAAAAEKAQAPINNPVAQSAPFEPNNVRQNNFRGNANRRGYGRGRGGHRGYQNGYNGGGGYNQPNQAQNGQQQGGQQQNGQGNGQGMQQPSPAQNNGYTGDDRQQQQGYQGRGGEYRPKPMEEVMCYNCGQMGHYKRTCTNARPNQPQQPIPDVRVNALSRIVKAERKQNTVQIMDVRVAKIAPQEEIPSDTISIQINKVKVEYQRYLMDTGSPVNLISKAFADEHKFSIVDVPHAGFLTVDNKPMTVIGGCYLSVKTVRRGARALFYVFEGLKDNVLIGRETLRKLGIRLVDEFGNDYMKVSDNETVNLICRIRASMGLSLQDEQVCYVWRDAEDNPKMIAEIDIQNPTKPAGKDEPKADISEGASTWENMPKAHDGEIREEDFGPELGKVWGDYVEMEEMLLNKGTVDNKEGFKDEIQVGSDVPEAEQDKIKEALWEVRKSFCSENVAHGLLTVKDLGSTAIQHSIHTTGGPFKVRPRRIPLAQMTDVEASIRDLLETGVIRPSVSPYASCIVMVKKKDGSWRQCVDYRTLNAQTVPDRTPIPRINELLDETAGRQWYSALDVKSAFHNVLLREEDIPKTAFIVGDRLYEYLRMPFGLSTAAQTFQRVILDALKDVPNKCCKAYLDDVLIYSDSLEQHEKDIQAVSKALGEAGLRLNPKKCMFAQTEVKYLGHLISRDGIKADPEKVEAVRDYPMPNTKRQLRRFLGIARYLSRFYKDLERLLKPLNKILSDGQRLQGKLKWTQEALDRFEELKVLLSSPPCLVPPKVGERYYLITDASDTGYGGVLTQEHDGELRPIFYTSKACNSAELNYSTVEREARAVIHCLDKYRAYLLGEEVVVYTDHKPLVGLFAKPDPTSARLYRWILNVQQYRIQIVYIPGIHNDVADALSRVYEPDEVGGKAPRIQFDDEGDPIRVNCFNAIRAEASTDDMRKALMERFHAGEAGAHSSWVKLVKLASKFYSKEEWPTMVQDAKSCVHHCNVCRMRSTRYEKLGLQPLEVPSRPGQRWHLDFTLLRSNTKVPALAVAVDAFPRWVVVVPAKHQDTDTSIKLMDKIWHHSGHPDQICSDAGTHFTSRKFQEQLEEWEIDHTVFTPYQKNEQWDCGTGHSDPAGIIAKKLVDKKVKGDRWTEVLDEAVLAYNVAPHKAMGEKSPYEIERGLPFSYAAIDPTPRAELEPYWAECRKQMVKSQEIFIRRKRGNVKETRFYVGQKVWIQHQQGMRQRKRKVDMINTLQGEIVRFKHRSATVLLEDGKVIQRPLSMLQPRFEEEVVDTEEVLEQIAAFYEFAELPPMPKILKVARKAKRKRAKRVVVVDYLM